MVGQRRSGKMSLKDSYLAYYKAVRKEGIQVGGGRMAGRQPWGGGRQEDSLRRREDGRKTALGRKNLSINPSTR